MDAFPLRPRDVFEELRKTAAPDYPNGQQASWYEGEIEPRIIDRGSVHK